MSMTSNPTTGSATVASFSTPDKVLTHLGRYMEPTSGKLVWLTYDQTNHKINIDATTTGAVAPASVTFRTYEQLRLAFYGKNLVRLGAFSNPTGIAQAWYDPATNIVYVDTTT